MPNLYDKKGEPICWKDCETMRKALEPYGLKDTGPIEDQNMYVVNDNATFKKVSGIMTNIQRRMNANPEKRYLVVYVIACHGMNNGGEQMIVLNEFNKKTGFYKLYGIEA